jgi:hypothetical protein
MFCPIDLGWILIASAFILWVILIIKSFKQGE